MGRLILIILLGAGVLFSITSINTADSNFIMADSTYAENQRLQAKDYAAGGIDMAIMKLSYDTAWTGVSGKQLKSGTVTISIVSTKSQFFKGPDANLKGAKLIMSTGNVGNQHYTVRSVIQLPIADDTVSGVPGFLDYAICTGENLNLNGNVNVQDDNNTNWNANVHTNKTFFMNGNNTIKGFLTYGDTATSNPAKRMQTNITPNQNPGNVPNYYKSDPVTIPSFNPDNYKSKATTIYPSDASINGNISLGTKDNPGIVYVGGNLTLNGNVSGYGVFIVKGNITLNGNVTVNSLDPSGSSVGLYTAGDLLANGNVSIYAQILTGGDARLNGNCKVYGSLTTKGTVLFNGNTNVYYRPASGALTNPFWSPQVNKGNGLVRPKVISYY